MTRRPDEDYDVIVHYFGQRGTRSTGRDTWTIWLGGGETGGAPNARSRQGTRL